MTTNDHLFGLTDDLPPTGKVSGYAKIPFSSDASAYGFIPLPIAIIGGGEGPTVLLLAGSYGDELESQVAVARIARLLDPSAMNGRVIIVPMANAPAARAGLRNSPLDGANLSRSYPGDVRGTPTRVIADYIERHLMSVSDIVLDLHSDGRSIRYLPCATMIHHADPTERSLRLAAALAFGAPSVLIFHSFEERNTSGAARRAGAVRIATEIGGPDPIGTTIAGVMRVLRWAGITTEAPEAPSPESTLRVTRQDKDFIYAMADGVFEPAVSLGASVEAGALVGWIHDPSRPFAEPMPINAAASGTVVCTRGPGLAVVGDCVLHLASPADSDLAAEAEAARRIRWTSQRRRGGPAVARARSPTKGKGRKKKNPR
jgi:predicted deacylase